VSVTDAAKFRSVMIDNGAFNLGGFREPAFRRLLDRVDREPALKRKVAFVVAPDVVKRVGSDAIGDAEATLRQFPQWADELHARGYRVALAAQDGIEDRLDQVPWDKVDVLFMGGSKRWKMADDAYMPPGSPRAIAWTRMIGEAKKRDIPIHFGRVSSRSGIELAHAVIGARSVDSTAIGYAPRANTRFVKRSLARWNRRPVPAEYHEGVTLAAEDAIYGARAALASGDAKQETPALAEARAVLRDERTIRPQARRLLEGLAPRLRARRRESQ
jgi:hypothetical protein